MDERYREAVDSASTMLANALLADIPYLLDQGLGLDRFVMDMLRAVGLMVLSIVYRTLCISLVERAKGSGLTVHERALVRFKTLFGEVEVDSPYLWSRQTGASARPMKEVLGVTGDGASEAVHRAMVDFGSEKSFNRAAKSFKEHYGWEVGTTTVHRGTLAAAREAKVYVEARLQEASQASALPGAEQPGVETLVVELDGCDIRTGILMTAAQAGQTACEPDARVRIEQWKEVRTGLVRPLDSGESTYVCRMGPYPDMCEQVCAAACARGLTPRTMVIAPGDGGNGLREALAAPFVHFQYILDYPHLKAHCYETAEALGMEAALRHRWVATQMDRLWNGNVADVLADFIRLQDTKPNDRLRRLIAHLTRFADAVHYAEYKERGWPIGSGEIESAHRYVPQERLKIAGACWHPQSVNPMLALRVIRINGWWDDFWQWHAQERRAKRAS